MSVVLPPVAILNVLGYVVAQVRADAMLSEALDEYAARNPESDNVAIRWLSRKWGYEVTLKFGNDAIARKCETCRDR